MPTAVLDDLYVFTHNQRMGLQLSPGKCGVMRIGSLLPASSYTTGPDRLYRLDVVKDLGVLVAPSLYFTEHVNNTVRKCSRVCSWILRSFVLCDPSIYLDLYRTYVIPHVDYCSVVWRPCFAKDCALLERMQNKFLRSVERKCMALQVDPDATGVRAYGFRGPLATSETHA